MLWMLLLLGCRERIGPEPGPAGALAPAAWSEVLAEAVDEHGDVDYDAIRAERDTLEAYLRWIARPEVLERRTVDQQHVFWMNAFNSAVIFQVVARDLDRSTLEVPSMLPWAGAGFWMQTELVVAGRPLSLWEIGHERVTHLTQDYRDFAALSLASRSGPPVPPGLFNAREMDAQLDAQADRFFGSERAVRIAADGGLSFNPIFDRYDLEMELYGGERDLCALAALHSAGERRRLLAEASAAGCPHDFFAFDWTLNQAEPR